MIPNADCGRARRESESGGSRIVSSHFDAELKTLAKKKKKKSNVCHERRMEEEEKRGRGEERRREETEGVVQNMLTPFAYVHSPLFH